MTAFAAAMKPIAARALRASSNQALPPKVGKRGSIAVNFSRRTLACQACGQSNRAQNVHEAINMAGLFFEVLRGSLLLLVPVLFTALAVGWLFRKRTKWTLSVIMEYALLVYLGGAGFLATAGTWWLIRYGIGPID